MALGVAAKNYRNKMRPVSCQCKSDLAPILLAKRQSDFAWPEPCPLFCRPCRPTPARVFNFAQTPPCPHEKLTASVLVVSKNSLGGNHMTKLLTKTGFGLPSQEVMERIDALREAGYWFEARLRELERQFDAKARELRGEYLSTVDELNGEE